VLRAHRPWTWKRCLREAYSTLERLLPDGFERIADSFPHQLSGGERQRVLIAQAIACSPELIIADEPTAALDSTLQADILNLLRDLKRSTNASFLFITHHPALLGGLADDVITLQQGVAAGPRALADILRTTMARPNAPSPVSGLSPPGLLEVNQV